MSAQESLVLFVAIMLFPAIRFVVMQPNYHEHNQLQTLLVKVSACSTTAEEKRKMNFVMLQIDLSLHTPKYLNLQAGHSKYENESATSLGLLR